MRKAIVFVLVLLFVGGVIIHWHLGKESLAQAQQPSAAPATKKQATQAKSRDFPQGTATPSVECGECHHAIYREYAFGFGSDSTYKPMAYKDPREELLSLPGRVLTAGSAHSFSGTDPWPMHARDIEAGGKSCNVCHYPEPFELPDLEKVAIERPKGRPQGKETAGITCASCHLTPDGKIRGPYGAEAPHETVKDPKIQTAVMCAHCHSAGKRVVGKQTQTFLEWRDDFHNPGLGSQQCQDCHMPRTLRKSTADKDVPVRAIARHLWTGGHSPQRISGALSLAIVSEEESASALSFHLINIGAGHSVPTGSNRRAIYLKADVVDGKGKVVAKHDWMFAPWYGDRPDDKAFLKEDKKRPDALSATLADAQGPHETIIRAGEEHILSWDPKLKKGQYEVRASLIYDLNRYNDRNFKGDQTTMFRKTLPFKVK
jgi:nitrate/TMAO reductase-like tetraheme cytochrome c subunit